MFIRTKFHINRLTQTYFTAFLYVLSDHPSYIHDPRTGTQGDNKSQVPWSHH